MAKTRFFVFIFWVFFFAATPAVISAMKLGAVNSGATDSGTTDLGFSAGALFPYRQFKDLADIGFSAGYHVKVNVYKAFNYGLAVNYGTAQGNNRVDFWAVDIYPFIDWIFFRTKHADFFTRGGIGLFHWESDNIWWLDSEGNGIVTTFGAGCNLYDNFEILANITKYYADFDVDCFLVRLGYSFDLGD
jgi:hypothetical protein